MKYAYQNLLKQPMKRLTSVRNVLEPILDIEVDENTGFPDFDSQHGLPIVQEER